MLRDSGTHSEPSNPQQGASPIWEQHRVPRLPGFIVCGRGTATPWLYRMWEGHRVPRLPGFTVCGKGTVCRDSPAFGTPGIAAHGAPYSLSRLA
jgi:hypothetical protein